MKKLFNVLVLVLLAVFAVNLTACGNKDNGDDDKEKESIYDSVKKIISSI